MNATAPEGSGAAMPKAMLVFAHPDDEVLAVGARLGRFRHAHLVHVTDGAPRNEQDSRAHGFGSWAEYREARVEELERALKLAGVGEASRESFEIPDQEASLRLLQLTELVAERLNQHRPEVVFTHPYEGGHPDHDACAFAVHHASALAHQRDGRVPLIVEATFYHAGPQGIATGSFLEEGRGVPEAAYPLTAEERERKRRLLECFATQQETLRYFRVECEQFRVAPAYDFKRPPHAPPVFYDQFPWGMTSARFCELAGEAEAYLAKEMTGVCR